MRRLISPRAWFAAPALLASLSACTSSPPPPPSSSAASACPETRKWEAWLDAMPGPSAELRLIVTGEVQIPEGMIATLTAGPLDRMMPPGQRFALTLSPGTGPSGWQQLRTEIKPAQSAYRMVLIGCDEKEIGRIDDIKTLH